MLDRCYTFRIKGLARPRSQSLQPIGFSIVFQRALCRRRTDRDIPHIRKPRMVRHLTAGPPDYGRTAPVFIFEQRNEASHGKSESRCDEGNR